MFTLRAKLIDAGFPDVKMNNILTAGVEISPTARACYAAELFNAGKTFYKRHLRNAGAVQVSYPSRFKLELAREREDYFQRSRKAERELARECRSPRVPKEPKPQRPRMTLEEVLGS